MGNDLALDPLTALPLYCARVRIETMFAMLTGVLDAFAYRFWSTYLPRHSRTPKKHAALSSATGPASAQRARDLGRL